MPSTGSPEAPKSRSNGATGARKGLALAIQTHPQRAVRIAGLLEACGGPWTATSLIVDVGGPPAAPWRTYKRCLEADVGHRVILQDDALPCRGFREACMMIAGSHPDRVVCLYHGRHPHHSHLEVLRAAEACERYAEITPMQWVPLVGVIWPPDLAARCAEDVGTPQIGYADDGLVSRWMHKQRIYPLVAIPNLVNHDDTTPTLMRPTHTRQDRSTICWIGEADAATFDW